MSATPHDGAGTVLTWNSNNGGTVVTATTYLVTSITYNLADPATDDKIDISHLAMTTGNSVLTMDRPLKGTVNDTGREVVIEYQGKSIFADAVSGTLTITHSGASFLSNVATVASSSVAFTVNDLIRGNATFRVAR